MNEKLTPEQRDWIMRLVETHLPETMGRQIVREALTALTPEDERHDCIKHLRQLGWNVTEPAEYDGLTGKYLKGDLSKANPVAIKPKTEDEGNYIVWSDGRKTQIEDEELLQYIAENIQQEGE